MRSFHRLISVAAVGACVAGCFSGCAKAPEQDLGAAKAAVKAARDAEADKYMRNSFQNLEKTLSSAVGEVEIQNNTFILSRNYTKAKVLLKNTTDLAKQITDEAPGRKAEIKTQVWEGLTSAKQMAKETHDDIKKAPRSKGKEVIAQMKADLNEAESAIAQGTTEFEAGNIIGAWDKLTSAQQLLTKIFGQLSASGEEGLM